MVLESHVHYFPSAYTPELQPFATAFVNLMFAHAQFERQFRELQSAITNDPTFGEQAKNQWSARKRPRLLGALIESHLGEIAESAPIKECLRRAVPLCDERNVLAHGT